MSTGAAFGAGARQSPSGPAPSRWSTPRAPGPGRARAPGQEVVGDSVRPGVQALFGQRFPERHDLFFELAAEPSGRRQWAFRTRRQPLFAPLAVAGHQLVQPGLGHPVGLGHLSHRAALEHYRVYDVASEFHAHTSSCWCPRCLATCVRYVLEPDTTPSDTTPSDTTPSDTTPSDTTPSVHGHVKLPAYGQVVTPLVAN